MTEPVRRNRIVEIVTEVAVCPARGCWEEFKPAKSNQVYCSDTCRRRACDDRKREAVTDMRNSIQ